MSARALPNPTALTQPFWDAARRHELVRPVCGACSCSFFTPQICCPRCLSEDWSYERSSGRGVVYSATIAHRAPLPGFEAPYQLAIVDLEEGWHMLANMIATPAHPGPTPIGTAVQVTFVEVAEGWTFPVFQVGRGVAEQLPTESRRDFAVAQQLPMQSRSDCT